MIRKGMSRDERMRIKAEQDEQARAYFDRMFPGCMELLDEMTRMTQTAVSAYRKEHSEYRSASEYAAAIDRLCGNPHMEDEDLDRNIAEATIAVRKKKGGAAA